MVGYIGNRNIEPIVLQILCNFLPSSIFGGNFCGRHSGGFGPPLRENFRSAVIVSSRLGFGYSQLFVEPRLIEYRFVEVVAYSPLPFVQTCDTFLAGFRLGL